MRATATRQQNVRQAAHELIPKLRQYNLPTSQLEGSARAMAQVEEAIKSRSGIGIRRAYNKTLNALRTSHQAVGKEVARQYTGDKALAKRLQHMLSPQQRQQFKGYEHMISAYFEALAQGKDQE